MARVPQNIRGPRLPIHMISALIRFGALVPRIFPICTTKMKGAGPQILCTGAKFKRVPCQKSCRVNRALVSLFASFVVKTANLLISRCSHAENCTCSSIFHHTAAAQPHVHQFFFFYMTLLNNNGVEVRKWKTKLKKIVG